MSARIERLIEDELGKLPPHHPDRDFLISYADSLHLYNIEHEASLTPHQLVQRESYEWYKFFGERTSVPTPPKELIEVRQCLREVGLNDFGAVFIPKIRISKRSNFPGYRVKLSDDFWDIHAKYKDLRLNETQDAWMLFNLTKRPHYSRGMQGYDHDGLYPFVEKLRDVGRVGTIIRGDYMLPDGSRFGTAKEELQRVIYPELAHMVKVAPEQTRSSTPAEYNLLGNRTFSEFHTDTTLEWFHGVTPDGAGFAGGVNEIIEVPKNRRSKKIGFRPVIVFS